MKRRDCVWIGAGASLHLLSGCRTQTPETPPPDYHVAPPSTVSASAPSEGARKIYLVIDDSGLLLSETERFLRLPIPLTIAVLPHLDDTRRVVHALSKHPDKEMILHQPMEAKGGNNPGLGAIMNHTNPAAVASILRSSLKSVPGVRGMNNHMGSLVTENDELMLAVLSFCKENNLYFLDSKTAYNSKVPRIGSQLGMPIEERDVFLDIKKDRASIERAWAQAQRIAAGEGSAVVIGHVWSPVTAAVLRETIPEMLQHGYTFHCLSELYA